ncbi:MAG: NAD(P)-binding domain-containing protein [Bacteroidales bacterium]
MKIAIIGAGNVGGALAKQWAKAGHTIFLGLRDLNSNNAKALEKISSNISSRTIEEAIKK